MLVLRSQRWFFFKSSLGSWGSFGDPPVCRRSRSSAYLLVACAFGAGRSSRPVSSWLGLLSGLLLRGASGHSDVGGPRSRCLRLSGNDLSLFKYLV